MSVSIYLQSLSDAWDFSFSTLWPQVMMILGPFGPWIGMVLGIVVAGVLLRQLIKLGR